MYADHQDGFERERKFNQILGNACRENPIIKARTVKKIIAHVAPDFLDGLFEPRPCIRRLKYIGCGCDLSQMCVTRSHRRRKCVAPGLRLFDSTA